MTSNSENAQEKPIFKYVRFLMNQDWLDENYYKGFLGKDLPIKKILNKQVDNLSKVGVTARVVSHWVEKGIVDDNRTDKTGWRKFSPSELVWLKIVVKLRDFGLDINKILKAKSRLELDNKRDQYSKFPILDFYIGMAIAFDMPIKMMVFHDGHALIGRQIDVDLSKQSGILEEDYISIDLSRIVKPMFGDKSVAVDYLDYSLPEYAKRAMKAVDVENAKSVKISVSGIKDLLLEREFEVKDKSTIEHLIKKLEHDGYGRFEIIHKNGRKSYRLIDVDKLKS